ncbi:MAG: hypothetical protein ACTS73_00885 [Arsenophonus sp. NEOnobi-MAG3]
MTLSVLIGSRRIPAVLLDLCSGSSFLQDDTSLKTLPTKHKGLS